MKLPHAIDRRSVFAEAIEHQRARSRFGWQGGLRRHSSKQQSQQKANDKPDSGNHSARILRPSCVKTSEFIKQARARRRHSPGKVPLRCRGSVHRPSPGRLGSCRNDEFVRMSHVERCALGGLPIGSLATLRGESCPRIDRMCCTAVPAGVLVHIHRCVGRAQQAILRRSVFWIERDSNAGRTFHNISFDRKRFFKAALQPKRDLLDLRPVANLGQSTANSSPPSRASISIVRSWRFHAQCRFLQIQVPHLVSVKSFTCLNSFRSI